MRSCTEMSNLSMQPRGATLGTTRANYVASSISCLTSVTDHPLRVSSWLLIEHDYTGYRGNAESDTRICHHKLGIGHSTGPSLARKTHRQASLDARCDDYWLIERVLTTDTLLELCVFILCRFAFRSRNFITLDVIAIFYYSIMHKSTQYKYNSRMKEWMNENKKEVTITAMCTVTQ